MKIGILTFHCAHNYGAVLQAYALQEAVKELGYDVEIINYRPAYLIDIYKPFSVKRIFSGSIKLILKKFLRSILMYPKNLKRWKVFNSFINKNLNISTKSLETIFDMYDVYIIGSDQIWNNKITKGFDEIYWGLFNTKKSSKKITYAASFGNIENLQEETPFLEKALMKFDAISLREYDYLEFIQSIRREKVYKVLDPTLILDDDIWNKVATKPNISDKYVFVYQVISSSETNRIASDIAEQIKGVVIEIPASIPFKIFGDKYDAVSPFDFLGWIKYATCVVTSSFHGTAFSIIYNKDFYTINLDDGSEKRPKDLLNNINLSDRLISKGSYVNFEKADYTHSDLKLKKLKKESIDYLKNNLI